MITHESKTKRLVKCPYCPKRICAGKVLAVHLRLQHAKEHNLSPEQRLAIVKNLIPNEEETERYLAEEAVVVRRGKVSYHRIQKIIHLKPIFLEIHFPSS